MVHPGMKGRTLGGSCIQYDHISLKIILNFWEYLLDQTIYMPYKLRSKANVLLKKTITKL